ncbi:MAG: hypothetical protein II776_07595, partial [Clostridia bacterium]|nr:hypothetical protein [Clostridia bacterium]
MKPSVKRTLSLLLSVVMIACLLPTFSVTAEKTFVGGITSVALTVDHEPHTDALNEVNYFYVPWKASLAEGESGYEVGFSSLSDKGSADYDVHFYNGVAWYDDTAGRYLNRNDTFEFFHAYTLQVALHITGSIIVGDKINPNAWFRTYGEVGTGDEVPAVSAT